MEIPIVIGVGSEYALLADFNVLLGNVFNAVAGAAVVTGGLDLEALVCCMAWGDLVGGEIRDAVVLVTWFTIGG